MSILPEAPLALRNAGEFCSGYRIKLSPEGRTRLTPVELDVAQFLDVLRASHCQADARRVLAHVLPKRHALWWGCLCAWEAYRPEPPAVVLEVLHAVAAFVQEPTDEVRRTLYGLGRAAGINTLAGQLAMAAFCSGGSLGMAGLPPVPPRPYLTGRLVGVAVYLASVLREPARYKERLEQFLALGLEVARGENLWPTPEPAPADVSQTASDVPVPAPIPPDPVSIAK